MQCIAHMLAGNGLSNEPCGEGGRTEMLDATQCDRARLARDATYDGLFYTGVRTTGVYCRPVCPVRPAQSGNVRFFPSAAAAEAAGFRPCLRCRPETAPFSPTWNGSRTTVARGLRLICNGALDGANAKVGELAGRLGIGERHLVRLFTKHLGASPGQVGKTLRVQRVKRLLDTTDLPMSEVALAAGFSSLRRFNAVVFDVYGRSPTELRRIRRQHQGRGSAPVSLDSAA
jgi:AraC family transcriptional regulator of adaptative response/methylated-DNA-[protein]-cysteine methyltransferase